MLSEYGPPLRLRSGQALHARVEAPLLSRRGFLFDRGFSTRAPELGALTQDDNAGKHCQWTTAS
jgi:hypothetical protein